MSAAPSILRNLIRTIVPRPVRNALRRPTVAAGRLVAKLKYMFGRSETVRLRSDWEVRCHPICVQEFRVFRDDPSQVEEMDAFISHCTSGLQILDLGAHWGAFSLAALRYGGPLANAICVEPSSAAARILRKNLKLNGVGDRVQVIEAAAGATPGEVAMLTTGAGGADYYVIPATPRSDTVRVQQISVSEICQQYRSTPTHLKIDVEGYEEEVLIGATDCIKQCRPLIFLELHGDLIRARGRDPQKVVTTLMELGYGYFETNGRSVSVKELAAGGFNARLLCRS